MAPDISSTILAKFDCQWYTNALTCCSSPLTVRIHEDAIAIFCSSVLPALPFPIPRILRNIKTRLIITVFITYNKFIVTYIKNLNKLIYKFGNFLKLFTKSIIPSHFHSWERFSCLCMAFVYATTEQKSKYFFDPLGGSRPRPKSINLVSFRFSCFFTTG